MAVANAYIHLEDGDRIEVGPDPFGFARLGIGTSWAVYIKTPEQAEEIIARLQTKVYAYRAAEREAEANAASVKRAAVALGRAA